MKAIDEIKRPVAEEMVQFEAMFRDSMKTRVPLLDTITGYIVRRKGKQVRPLFVFLSAGTCSGITESTYRAASLIELLHTATLVHDDVVDDSMERRGFFSLNALWKNKIAVLVGDFLLSKGLLFSLEHDDFGLLKIVSNAVKEMSEGELLQIEKARNLDLTEAVYFDIIRQKTASLIASCCACGAHSSGQSPEETERMRRFGEAVGIAFQLKDDLFDYGTADIGKPVGADIRDKKITLPLLYTLQVCKPEIRKKIRKIIHAEPADNAPYDWIADQVRQHGGLVYASGKMLAYRDAAMEILSTYPDSPYKTSLQKLVNYTIERDK